MYTLVDELNRRWQALCADIAHEARLRGAKDPFIFACESGLCILDGPPVRGDQVLFKLAAPPRLVVSYDAGGW